MLTDEKVLASPFLGIVPFSEDDAPLFFGRDSERKIISATLRTRRLTLLYGPTAVGKSSVLMAGVVPNLRALNTQLELAHVGLWESADEFGGFDLSSDFADSRDGHEGITKRRLVIVAVFSKWLGDPLISLKDKICNALSESLPKVFTEQITEDLLARPLPLMLKEITSYREVLELLIILDQFEEYFVYHPTRKEVADRFADEFCRAVATQDLRVNFLISIREDWLARLDRFKGKIPYLFDNSIRINHLNREAAYKAVKGPVDTYNKIIKAHSAEVGFDRQTVNIEEQFIAEVLDQLERLDDSNGLSVHSVPVAIETGSIEARIQTSRLQIVLKYLWEKAIRISPPNLSFDLVRKPDTAKRIINTNLHKTLNRLHFWEKLIAADFFRFLVTTSTTKLADTAQGLADRIGVKQTRIKPVLDKLSRPDFRVLKQVGPPPGEPSPDLRYELTSDALAGPVLDWAKDILAKKRLILTAGAGVVGTLILIVIFIFIYRDQKAQKNQQIAEARQTALEEASTKQQRAFDAWKRLDDQIPYSKAVLRRHGDRVTSAVFTPTGDVLTASADGTAILWDVEKKEPRRDFDPRTKGVISAAISPAGDRVVTASEDGSVILWRVGSAEKSELRGRTSAKITGISFNSKGDIIAAADAAGAVTVWNTESGNLVKELGNGKPVGQLVFSPNGELLAGASEDNTVRIWTTLDWSERNSLNGHAGRINSLAFTPDEKFLATGSADTTARIWDLSSGTLKETLLGHEKSINSVDFDRDGKLLLTASDDTTARIWSIDSGKSKDLIGHTDKVLSASFSPDSHRVVTASGDGVVRIWSTGTGQSLAELRGHIDQVTYVSYSNDGKYVLSAGDDSTARVWLADESGNFDVAQPAISAIPSNPIGECPITIRFFVNLTVSRGRGKIVYRFKGSDGRIWPPREAVFDGPGTKYVNWYWKVTENYTGSETIEIMEPKGIKEQKAKFTVACFGAAAPQPEAKPTATP
jgi:WD40 repeat protein